MPQHAIEVILTRQWASHLTVPVWIADQDEKLVFYNEPAEALLGRRFEDVGQMSVGDLTTALEITDDDGTPVALPAFPLIIALRKRRPAHQTGRFRPFGGVWKRAEITAFPLDGQGGRNLGAVAIFWEMHHRWAKGQTAAGTARRESLT